MLGAVEDRPGDDLRCVDRRHRLRLDAEVGPGVEARERPAAHLMGNPARFLVVPVVDAVALHAAEAGQARVEGVAAVQEVGELRMYVVEGERMGRLCGRLAEP
ncbi:MAG: hypothetical protein ACRENI_06895 [Gemmatimonadaceae bacterium]